MTSKRLPLVGYAMPIPSTPCFVVPVFSDGSSWFAQLIDTDRIVGFEAVNIGEEFVSRAEVEIEVEVGDDAIFGFAWPGGQAELGTALALVDSLQTGLSGLAAYKNVRREVLDFVQSAAPISSRETAEAITHVARETTSTASRSTQAFACRLFVIAHAPLATSLKAVAMHAFPDLSEQVGAFDVAPDMSVEEVESRARSALSLLGTPHVLILTDVFGATPCNIAQKLADGINVRVLTGVSVPMLWRALGYLEYDMDALIARALAGATQGAMQVSTPRPRSSSKLHRPQLGKPDEVTAQQSKLH